MYSKLSFLFLPLLLLATLLPAQVPKDVTIAVTATLSTNPANVTISWPNPAASTVLVLRHIKGTALNLWTSLLNVTNSSQTAFVDNLVNPGQVYEYAVQRTVGGVTSYGYAHVAFNTPVVDGRGKLIFLVDSLLMGPLGNEIGRLKLDMMAEGWIIVPHIIGSGATVQTVKSQIVADYNADAFNTKMVFLLGALPVPYSGNTAWDNKTDHQGAWPSDSYYGDINGIWTDVAVNNTTAARAANDNVPGDKKFDQITIPSAVELAVGRVDFRHLTTATFGTSQVELYRRYLDKDHAWRTKAYTVANKVVIDDNLGYASGEAFAADGYRNAYPLVGASNVVEADFSASNPNGYLLGYGAGAGTYTSVDGVGTSANFATSTVNVAFSLFFGDYFGDWDSETDPFLPSVLASRGGILATAWAGRPHVFLQGLASGETIGYCMKETQNAQYNTAFLLSSGTGRSGTHVSLLGDPTLRAQVVAPPSNLLAVGQCGTVTLNWTAPVGGAADGYHVYRSTERNGFYDRLTADPLEATSFADNMAPGDTLYYQVRAIQQVSTPGGGSYANASLGATVSLVFAPMGVPIVNLTGGTLTCTRVSVALSGVIAPNTATWIGPGGYTSAQANPSVTRPGVYIATVTAPNGCSTMSEVAVLIDTFLPTFTIPPFPPLSCLLPCGIITLPETPGYQVVLDGTILQTGVPYSVCDTGLHTVILRSLNNGCEDSYSAILTEDVEPPGANATSSSSSCGPPFQLQGSSETPNVTYAWAGPDGFASTQQNPTVTATGFYQLTVRDTFNGCTSSASVVVEAGSGAPNISATGGILTCSQQTITIQGISTTPGATFTWTGPGGFTSAQQNPTVTLSGTYVLTVTAPSGCAGTASVVVTANTAVPNVTATGTTLTCSQPTAALPIQGNSTTSGVTYLWTGPNGFTSTQQNPPATVPGTYVLVVTAPNGCTNSATAVFIADITLPTATATGAVFPCNQTTATIMGTSNASGATFTWSGPGGFTSSLPNPTVMLVGTYILTVSAPNGCTSTASTQVSSGAAANATAIGATLTCSQPTATIQGSSTNSGASFAWTGPGGFTSNQQNPTVSTAGTYVLTVTVPGGCSNTASATVNTNSIPPIVTAAGTTLTCIQPTGTIQGSSVALGASFLWTGPGGFTSTQPNPTVTLAGTYLLTVTAANSCTATATAVVLLDASLPTVTATGTTLACNQPTGTIQGSSTTTGAVYLWTGPNGFTSTQPNPTVTVAGTYVLVVTAPTGCSSTASVQVISSVAANATAIGATLTCSQPTATIQGNSTNSGATFAWTGPGGFTSNQQNPTVSTAGTYTLTVTASGGCTSTANATVNTNSIPPIVTATGTTLTCTQPTGTIQGSSVASGASFLWTGPGGFTSTQANPTVTLGGTYLLTVTAANSCTATATAIVTLDATLPNITASGTTLTCGQPTGTIQGNSTTLGAIYLWTGPNGFTSTQPNPTVTVAGTYVLLVTAPTGCFISATVQVSAGVAPNATANGATLTCSQPTATIQGNSTTSGATFAWTGPGGFISNQQNPTVNAAGTYTLTVTVPGSCTSTATATVNTNNVPPNITATGTTLTCAQPTGTIQGSSVTSGSSFLWTGPGGFTSTLPNPTVTLAGTYLLTVTAANSCVATATAVVSLDASLPTVTATGTTLTCSQPTGTIQGSSTSTGAIYLWTGPNGFTSTQPNPTVTAGGTYILRVTALTGCFSSATVEVISNMAAPDISVDQPDVLDCNTACVTVAIGSTTPGAVFASQEYCLPGIYTAVVTAPNGCSSSQSFEVIQASPLGVAISLVTTDCAGAITLTAIVSGGTAPYQYIWSNGDTTATTTTTISTNLTVSITDAGGCSLQSPPVNVVVPLPIQIGTQVVDVSAIGLQNGSIVLTVQGGDCLIYEYLWSNGATTSAIVNLSADTYTVTITCPLTGCTTVATVEVQTTVGTEDAAFWKKLSLSPNPTDGQVLLTLLLPEATALRVKVLDVVGRVVLTLPETTLLEASLPLDLRHCPSGMYTVLLSTKNEVAVRKLMVVKQ